MMNRDRPVDRDQWLNRIYCGDLYKLPSDEHSICLVDNVRKLLVREFKTNDINLVHRMLDEHEFFSAMKNIRKALFDEPLYIELVRNLILSLGFKRGEVAFEPLRLRAIRHNGHLNPSAKAVYYPHRDTWYGHGQSMVVGWLPLHNQTEAQTFEIYPDFLAVSVANNSEVFDYNLWRSGGDEKKIGWQKATTGLTAVYPQALNNFSIKGGLRFSANKAEHIIFSGSHFHKTLEQSCNITRFSVDYRLVCLADDAAGRGAINIDNRSTGSALQDYHIL